MNKVIISGRATADAKVTVTTGTNAMTIARVTLAVDRRFKRDGEQSADFPSVVAFGKVAEFLEKYGRKGVKFEVCGRLQTGSYTNKDGVKVYTTDVIADEVSFAESKANSPAPQEPAPVDADGFLNVDGIDEELPFC